jgi:hypothetical protein
MTLKEFNTLTPLELSLLMDEHHQKALQQYKESACLHRVLAMRIVNATVAVAGGDQITEPRRFLRFGWEPEIDEDIVEDLLNTDWEALDDKYAFLN